MSIPATQKQKSNGKEAPLVVISQPEGFDVYAADMPENIFTVSGDPEEPECTCSDYRWKSSTPGYQCRHIAAVFKKMDEARVGDSGQSEPPFNGFDDEPLQEVMVVKRSVSPDGRIDSLSIEFSMPVGESTSEEVEAFASSLIARQEAIIAAFMHSRQQRQTKNAEPNHTSPRTGPEPVAAILRDVGGMNTRYGWRYFINVEVNGQTRRLIGTKRQLSEHLEAADLGGLASNISKGVNLDARCRAILVPSADGRYQNIESLEPANSNGR